MIVLLSVVLTFLGAVEGNAEIPKRIIQKNYTRTVDVNGVYFKNSPLLNNLTQTTVKRNYKKGFSYFY